MSQSNHQRNEGDSNPKSRKLISPNLQAIEQRNLTETARVFVVTRPSERQSIFRRVIEGTTTPEAESKNCGLPRRTVLKIVSIEHKRTLDQARRDAFDEGYRTAKLEALRGPNPPARALRPSWSDRRAA